MGLTGIQIYKLLPQTNCKDCGEPTCLAFAMKLAAGKAELSKCPFVSEAAKAQLSEASAPPIRDVTLGQGDAAHKVGGETVKYRHEKTFVNPTGLAVALTNGMDAGAVDIELKLLNDVKFERVGFTLRPNYAFLWDQKKDQASFLDLVKKVTAATEKGLIVSSEDVATLKAAAELLKGKKFALHAATTATADQFIQFAKDFGCTVVAKGDSLEDLAAVGEKFVAAGLKEVLLDPGMFSNLRKALTDSIAIRRAALDKKFRALGFPTLAFPCAMTNHKELQAAYASMLMDKYAGIVVLGSLDPAVVLPLVVNRLNIFTDPQRPMTMDQGIYPINNPGPGSPLIITTNFALTYFVVSAEVEASRVPTWLLIMDTEGMSVLTAWSAGKFVADAMAPFVKKSGVSEKVSHKKIIIPGYVAQLSGEFQEELGEGWEVVIGTREAADIPKFLKDYVAKHGA
ncbi:MAG: acetyl-CoA decarbonylase/synthase complex subunit gamma [Deltaproteobacteria bacterium]|nr:acetyl-CoA decarbonylase/synthase complex subunit gamma [Deltaproteobacteria bacterium]